jgi:four helix bundle protein
LRLESGVEESGERRVPGFRRFEEIKGWQRARELVRDVYQICGSTGLARERALSDQLRRAVVSAMSNVAEGFSRKTDRDFAHFLDMARGSCSEVQSLLYVALDLGQISQQQFDALYESADATAAMISRLSTYLRSTDRPKSPPNDQDSGL